MCQMKLFHKFSEKMDSGIQLSTVVAQGLKVLRWQHMDHPWRSCNKTRSLIVSDHQAGQQLGGVTRDSLENTPGNHARQKRGNVTIAFFFDGVSSSFLWYIHVHL